ncbi:MAG: hypothetical protein LQ338_001328 [Usnochroma carphineum]|nr:MAG: hypothetical protein LQ338_001328 [Usnochroma carphineum]
MDPRSKKTIYHGTFIHTPSLSRRLSVLEHAAVGVDGDGVIRWVDGDAGGIDGDGGGVRRVVERNGWGGVVEVEVVGCEGDGEGWFFPGFVDTHTHASQLPNTGLFGNSTLLDWLTTYTFPLESSLADPSLARRVYTRAVTSTLRHGTTTAAYYATIHPSTTNLLADICLEKGQRAFVGRVCMDHPDTCPSYYRDGSAEAGMQATREVVEHLREKDPEGKGLVQPILTPRFAPSCSKEMLTALGKMAREQDLPVQTHISENKGEVKLVAKMFPERKSYADVYDFYGLLGPRTVLAHAIHLSEEEIGLVRERGSGVSHCPVSNTSLGSGIAPVRRLLDAGVKVGLGTDVSGGGSCSLLTAAREAGGVSRLLSSFMTGDGEGERNRVKLGVEECLFLATRGGAEVLGLEGKIGAFEVGMEWDAQMVRLEKVPADGGGEGSREDKGLVQVWGKETWEEKVAKWMYCGDDRNTRKVWVKGRLVHER